MAADYKKQYRPDQLESFWPNEIVKMMVAVLSTLAVIMFFAILPVLLEMAGIGQVLHHEEPANPQGATPFGIKPEWYFLSVYQYLRLMPTQILGVSGKTIGVLSQGLGVGVVVLLPFWYRRGAHRRPNMAFRAVVTAAIIGFLCLMIWGGWPEQPGGGAEQLIPLSQYVREQPMLFAVIGLVLAVFYTLIARERKVIRRILDSPPPPGSTEDPK